MARNRSRRLAGLVTIIAVAAGAAFYVQNGSMATPPEPPQQAAPPAVPVDTVTVEQRPVRLWRTFSARLEAVDEVDLRPQVSGAIIEVRFRDGQTVAKGDILFVIDPRLFEAAVAQAKADLAAARERHGFAGRELERARKLIASKTVPQRIFDQRKNDFATTGSEVEAASARLTQARLDLDHAYVKAPISGRVSRVEVTMGNLVQAGPNSPVLTSIVSNEGIYADFDVDEDTYLRYARAMGGGAAAESTIPVRLIVGNDGNRDVYEGRIHAFDNRIDPQTGTIRARSHFDNVDGRLLPGMFATVEMGTPGQHDRVLLSESAILTDQDRKFVYVVGDDNKVAYREVELGASVSGMRVITSGLSAGEQVIVGGMMVVRPNALVAPTNVASKANDDKTSTRIAAGQ